MHGHQVILIPQASLNCVFSRCGSNPLLHRRISAELISENSLLNRSRARFNIDLLSLRQQSLHFQWNNIYQARIPATDFCYLKIQRHLNISAVAVAANLHLHRMISTRFESWLQTLFGLYIWKTCYFFKVVFCNWY